MRRRGRPAGQTLDVLEAARDEEFYTGHGRETEGLLPYAVRHWTEENPEDVETIQAEEDPEDALRTIRGEALKTYYYGLALDLDEPFGNLVRRGLSAVEWDYIVEELLKEEKEE